MLSESELRAKYPKSFPLPTVRPGQEWRGEDEKRDGMPLWAGEGELTVSEQVKRDILAEAKQHMEALRDSVAGLKAERAACEVRMAELDLLLSELGDVAKPKRGRPRGKKAAEVAG